jgi:hypothetical protein
LNQLRNTLVFFSNYIEFSWIFNDLISFWFGRFQIKKAAKRAELALLIGGSKFWVLFSKVVVAESAYTHHQPAGCLKGCFYISEPI